MNRLAGPVFYLNVAFARLDLFFRGPSLKVDFFEVFSWLLLTIHQVR